MLKLTLVAVIALVAVSVTPKRNTVTLTKIMRERMNCDHELNMNLMMVLFEQLYDRLLEFINLTPAQRYLRLLDRYPRITEIASYGDIASPLNISRRQLQRIREIIALGTQTKLT